jgi:hypothetical protein
MMVKSAEHIAAEVLFKFACIELYKEAVYGRFSGAGRSIANHLLDRVEQRIVAEERARVIGILESLINRLREAARSGRMITPNADWYREIRSKNGDVIGYLCGRGREPITVLGPGMVPRGTRLT